MDAEFGKTCFVLGLQLAEYVHGVKRRADNDPKTDAIFDTLRQIAEGTFTLMDTPEELIASLPEPPPGITLTVDHPLFREMVRVSRENQKIAANAILPALPK